MKFDFEQWQRIMDLETEDIEALAIMVVSLEADRDVWRSTAARWERGWQLAVDERDNLRAKLAGARGKVDEVRYALSVMFDRSQGLSPEDWKKWAHGYIEFMIVDLDGALAAIKEE